VRTRKPILTFPRACTHTQAHARTRTHAHLHATQDFPDFLTQPRLSSRPGSASLQPQGQPPAPQVAAAAPQIAQPLSPARSAGFSAAAVAQQQPQQLEGPAAAAPAAQLAPQGLAAPQAAIAHSYPGGTTRVCPRYACHKHEFEGGMACLFAVGLPGCVLESRVLLPEALLMRLHIARAACAQTPNRFCRFPPFVLLPALAYPAACMPLATCKVIGIITIITISISLLSSSAPSSAPASAPAPAPAAGSAGPATCAPSASRPEQPTHCSFLLSSPAGLPPGVQPHYQAAPPQPSVPPNFVPLGPAGPPPGIVPLGTQPPHSVQGPPALQLTTAGSMGARASSLPPRPLGQQQQQLQQGPGSPGAAPTR